MSIVNTIGYLIAAILLIASFVELPRTPRLVAEGLVVVTAAYLLHSMMGKPLKAIIAPLVALAMIAVGSIGPLRRAIYGEEKAEELENYFNTLSGGVALGVILARLRF